MVSPLEVDQVVSDARDDPLASRHGPRREISRPAPSTLSSFSDNLILLPFMVMLYVLQITYQVICQAIGDPLETFRDFFTVNKEADEILKNVPKEQRKQQRQLHGVHEEQVHHREKLEDLRRRIQNIEDRRAARAQESLRSTEQSERSKFE